MFGNYGYAPYQYGTPQFPQVQQVPQSYQQPQATGITWVESDAGAEALRLDPGHSGLAMNANEMKLYMKSVDMSGIPTTRKFKLVEIQDQPSGNPGQFATREELQSLAKIVEQLKETIGGAANGQSDL